MKVVIAASLFVVCVVAAYQRASHDGVWVALPWAFNAGFFWHWCIEAAVGRFRA
jgi:hypothetical protein